MNIDTPVCDCADTHTSDNWFSAWFDSPYYHILYQERNDEEAHFFIDNLVRFLKITPEQRILDLASGRGRHSVYLHQKGFEVLGADLSPTNIAASQPFASERLSFVVHDMREVLREAHFDFVLNLFTSFGYFDSEEENLQAMQAIAQNLKPGGRLVIDFLNPAWVIEGLIPYEVKTYGGIDFHIHKKIEGGFVIKHIAFEDKGEVQHFQERVALLDLRRFESYFSKAGLSLEQVFGDYSLQPYEPMYSERMIFIVGKPAQ